MYYQVLFNEDGVFGVAQTVVEGDLFTLPYCGVVEDWMPLTLELHEGVFVDYLASNLGCRLCSERLKSIIQNNASTLDDIQWLAVDVRQGELNYTYWILHFPNPPDVLDVEKSIFAGDFVVKPVLSLSRINNHRVFSYPKAGELKLFVSEQVKRAIAAAGCTGLELSQAASR